MSRLDLELPYGVDQDGRMVPIDQVERGLACHCRCPQCDRRLIARQGEILRWHFAHETEESKCVGAFETMAHKLAKQIIADAGLIRIPALIGYFEGYTYRVIEEAREIALTDVRQEVWLNGIRPDILACRDDGTDLAIEVFVSHRSNDEKISSFHERRLAAIEIDLSDFRRSPLMTGDIFQEAILRGPRRTWLWNPRQAEANAIVAAEQEERRANLRAAAAASMAAREEWEAKTKLAMLARAEAKRKFDAVIQRADDRLAQEEQNSAQLEPALAVAALESEKRIEFLRSLPVARVDIDLTPPCKCRTLFMWHDGLQPWWRCFTCDPPVAQSDVEIIRAEITDLKSETIAA